MSLSLKDALREAARDPKFANEFVAHPEQFQTLYHLTDAQVAKIKSTSVQEILEYSTNDERSIASYY